MTVLLLSTWQNIFLSFPFSSANGVLALENKTDMINNLVYWIDSFPSKLQQFDCIFRNLEQYSTCSGIVSRLHCASSHKREIVYKLVV